MCPQRVWNEPERRDVSVPFCKMMNAANLITLSRIAITPVIGVLLFMDSFEAYLSASVLFLVAAFTDYIDGQVARSLHIKSRLGQFLDPLADKVLVIGVFVVLSVLYPHIVPWWCVVLIASRDLGITWLRAWHEHHQRSLKTFLIAKAKTSVQLIFIVLILGLLTASKYTGATSPDSIQDQSLTLLNSSIPLLMTVCVAVFTVVTGLIYVVSPHAVTANK